MRYFFKTTILLLSFLTSTIVYASSPQETISKFMKKQGLSSTYSNSKLIHDQSRGYLSGGSITTRGRRPEVVQPFHVKMPRFDIDPCSLSADISFGGLSYITGEDMKRLITNVAKVAPIYALRNAIKNKCPQCSETLNELQAIASKINQMSLDQCQAGKMIADTLFGAEEEAQRSKCTFYKTSTGSGSDIFKDMTDCSNGKGGASGSNEASDELDKSFLPDEYNIVWHALKSSGKAKETIQTSMPQKDLIEFCMSITGTVIASQKDGSKQYTYKPGLVTADFLTAIVSPKLDSGAGIAASDISAKNLIELYECSDAKCLDMITKNKNLNDIENLISTDVAKILRSLSRKVKDGNNNLTDSEQNLVSMSPYPLIPLIVTEYELKPGGENHIYTESVFVELLTFEMINHWINTILTTVEEAVGNLPYSKADKDKFNKVSANIESVKRIISEYRAAKYDKLKYLGLINKMIKVNDDQYMNNSAKLLENIER